MKFSVLFHSPCLVRYSVLHLIVLLSGGNEPPLCKGRWLAYARRWDCKSKILLKTIPQSTSLTAPFTQGSLWFVCPESPSSFPDKHCFCRHKSNILFRFFFYLCNFFIKTFAETIPTFFHFIDVKYTQSILIMCQCFSIFTPIIATFCHPVSDKHKCI